jgi:energy-converting hydrogenase Eha subunit F
MKNKLVSFVLPFAVLAVLATPSYAATTINTDPSTVLDEMVTGAGGMDDLSGLVAALGMSSTIFGGAALIFKRFVYS